MGWLRTDGEMREGLASFRRRVLASLRAACDRWPDSRLHLLYDPGFDDPLLLGAGDGPPPRETALVPWAKGAGFGKPQYPRIIELDCRRVAPCLLESHPAFDDPLLEDSITHAHRGVSAGPSEPDGQAGSGHGLCGWLASPDRAHTIAGRFALAVERVDPTLSRRYGLRLHDPRVMALLWPQLSDVQKVALLGDRLAWLAFDAAGHPVEFCSPDDAAGSAPSLSDPLHRLLPHPQLQLTTSQWCTVHRLGLVNHLIGAWRDRRDRPLPQDAGEAVHRAVLRAEDWCLQGRDFQVFVLTAVELKGGFEHDPHLRAAVRESVLEPGTLSDRIEGLPREFWHRYARHGRALDPVEE